MTRESEIPTGEPLSGADAFALVDAVVSQLQGGVPIDGLSSDQRELLALAVVPDHGVQHRRPGRDDRLKLRVMRHLFNARGYHAPASLVAIRSRIPAALAGRLSGAASLLCERIVREVPQRPRHLPPLT